MGPQLFSGWYQMILDVFRCNQLFSDVLCCFLMFSAWLQLLCMTTPCAMHKHPLCRHFLRMMSDVFRCSIDVFRRSQLFSDFLSMTSIDHMLARVYWTRASTCIKYTCQHVYYIHVLARVLYTHASTCVYARARPLLAKMPPGVPWETFSFTYFS